MGKNRSGGQAKPVEKVERGDDRDEKGELQDKFSHTSAEVMAGIQVLMAERESTDVKGRRWISTKSWPGRMPPSRCCPCLR